LADDAERKLGLEFRASSTEHLMANRLSIASGRLEYGCLADPCPTLDYSKAATSHHILERRQLRIALQQSHNMTIEPVFIPRDG
jgi:hypothetical protein